METARLAAHQKKARRLSATLVFWDESGFLMLPIVRRTWAPKGQTPVLHHNAKRLRKVSAIGMLTLSPERRRLGCYHLLQPDASIDETLVVAVLRQMRRHFRRPLIVLWDRLQAHRSHWVRNYLAATPDVLGFAKDPFALKPLLFTETDSFVAVATEEIAMRLALANSYQVREAQAGDVKIWQR